MHAQTTFRLPFRVERDGEIWVASCDVLDVVPQGVSREHAGRMLSEARQLFLEGCLGSGTLYGVLKRRVDTSSRPQGLTTCFPWTMVKSISTCR